MAGRIMSSRLVSASGSSTSGSGNAPHGVNRQPVGLSRKPALGGSFSGNLGCGMVGSKREECSSSRNSKSEGLRQPTSAASAVSPGEVLPLVHPDAIRRRAEAVLRKQTRRSEMKGMSGTGSWWELNAPSNLISIKSMSQFQNYLAEIQGTSQLVVVDFFAPWCRACRTLFPKLKQIAGDNPDVRFLKVNVEPEELKSMSEDLGVDRLPYFHFYRGDSGLVAHFTANLNPEQLKKLRKHIAECKKA